MARSAAAIALATVPERVSVLETKVDNIEEKLDDIKTDVKDMHDCLDRTRDTVMEELKTMQAAYWQNADKYYKHAEDLNAQQSAQHAELAGKIKELQTIKDKGIKYGMAILAFLAGSGWVQAMDLPKIIKFLGL